MIIEYEEKYLDDVRDLLVELEEYIISIDKDNLDIIHPDFKEKMAIVDFEELEKNNGKCYLYVEDEKALALIMGFVRPYDKYDYLDYKCPKTGIITELIVSKNLRSTGIGQKMIDEMEKYFKSIGCEYILVDVFAYNEKAINFYSKKDYHSRMHTMIKRIGKKAE